MPTCDPPPVTGDPVLLERLTQNLVDNAIRYNVPAQGETTMITGTVDDRAHLTVDNTGPPVPPMKSQGCSNPSGACAPPNASPTPLWRLHQAAVPAWDCPSCDPSPAPTGATSTPHPGRTAA
jgi:hypothetical protein